jgi:enterochelin esterase-like enzyme
VAEIDQTEDRIKYPAVFAIVGQSRYPTRPIVPAPRNDKFLCANVSPPLFCLPHHCDIIPFIQTHYNISDQPRERAIAGFSMGGLQSNETGIVHLGYFGWIGAFSPAVGSAALSDEFKNPLKDANKINENLRLFEIVTGAEDKSVGEDVTKFEEQLKQANVQHTYTVLPSGTHSMFVWRPALANFLQEIFKH